MVPGWNLSTRVNTYLTKTVFDMPADSDNETELVNRARAGDAEAYTTLVRRHQDRIFNAAFYLLSHREAARDITQDAFLTAYEKLDGFRGDAAFSTWVYGIMLNLVRNRWRKRKPCSGMLQQQNDDTHSPGIEPVSQRSGPFEKTDERERANQVREAINRLDEAHREAIVLRDIEGLSYERISEAMDLPLGTVKSRIYRARRKLKEELEPVFGSE